MFASIIGADGGMGQWLTTHLKRLGFDVTGFDQRRGDDPSVLGKSDLVVVSVPIGVTAEAIRKTVKHMKSGACLMEIASLKSGIHEAMCEAVGLGFDVLCVHPMFGPSATSLEDKTVAVIPVSDIESEIHQTQALFPDASIIQVEPESHDRLMSLILSLPYLVNLALAGTMRDEDLILLRKLSGTSFALQYTLIQSVTAETTSLVQALLSENQFLGESASKFIMNLTEIMKTGGSKKEFSELHNEIRASMRRDPIHLKAHSIRQVAYDKIRPLLR
ncbi:MAG: prephenate dehydrogenase/arogenate dehydrogenase family protein [Candidatus Bathyarchaeota archaeon]